jgi:hypothetical protein
MIFNSIIVKQGGDPMIDWFGNFIDPDSGEGDIGTEGDEA